MSENLQKEVLVQEFDVRTVPWSWTDGYRK